ncbi:hypothetical protein PPL_06902 [Heterostelium album PN500]|uniref:F-box domain-containing protein n=1 Tax=Heterostelium pallidum (strain ATCC 26659 / Pp 5 / PN500) TaxID=670386 RepID=D3BDU9_HETP5|nr:hypothetical protein PPL_06902 [Heterostelium album PN500]EFA80080.1 hypothetical protein PPL_06902 [Heterostelium album PN500]|eukprot:XP_020432200.1 hypothetical protein PPL_06902 [Heterostelium album PN500]
MTYTDNNDLHRFANLSFILLNKIISYLDQVLDRVCFSLVCKRWFDHRDKYLWFNSGYFLKSSALEINRTFKLNSYKELFQRSLNNNTNQKHLVIITYTSDYSSFLHHFKPYTVDFIKALDIRNDHIQILKSSNASTFCTLHSCQFQDNIRFPPSIKEIKTSGCINLSFLPQELEYLEMSLGVDYERSKLDISLLPRTLKVLKINGFESIMFDYESLPPNLEEFLYYAKSKQPLTPNNRQLPPTLKIVSISNHQLPYIKHLTSLHTLSVALLHKSVINVGDIPESVTDLTFNNFSSEPSMISRDIIPPNIKHLCLKRTLKILSDSQSTHIFTALLYLETLDLSMLDTRSSHDFGVLPTSLINISLPYDTKFNFDSLIANCNQLPNLKFIDYGGFRSDGDLRLNNTSIRSVKLNHTTRITGQTIPKSVEIIDFSNYRLLVGQDAWPSSIQSITVDIEFIDANDNLMNIPSSINNIIIKFLSPTYKHCTFNTRRLDQQFILLYANNLYNINSAILNINSLSNYIKNVAI